MNNILKNFMNLVLDIGNTNSKFSVYKSNKIIDFGVWDSIKVKDKFVNWRRENKNCESIVISDVLGVNKDDFEFIAKCHIIWISSRIKLPFKIKYKNPGELGPDRISLAAAAVFKYPKKNCLVIDIGTCITYDFISKNSTYLGGSISPGFTMRYTILNTNTSKLPRLKIVEPSRLIGGTTEECIHSGIFYGVIGEIENQINLYKKKYKDLTIILTGGDAKYLANRIKNGIFANYSFISKGLFNILNLNNQ